MTGNKNAWRAPLAGLASVAMVATMGVAAATANAAGAGTVTLDANGGKINFGQSTMAYDDNGDGDNDGKLALLYDGNHTPSYANYKFTGWYTAKTGGVAVSAKTSVAANSTLYAHWTTDTAASVNTITFADAADQYDEKAKAGADVDFIDDSASTGNVTVLLAQGDVLADWQIPGNTGAHDGWVNTSDGKPVDLATLTTDGKTPVTLEENPVADDAVVYTIGNWGVSDIQWSNGKKGVDSIALPATDPTPTVYFTNSAGEAFKVSTWAKGSNAGEEVDASDVKAGATLYSKNDSGKDAYKAVVNYVNDNDGSAVKMGTDYEYFDGSKYTTVDVSKLSAYEKLDGYTFAGWYTQLENNTSGAPQIKLAGKQFQDVFTNTTTRIANVFASFKTNADTVAVTFDPYYDGAEKTVKTLTKDAYFGNDLPVPARDGYTFQGWYKEVSFANEVTKDTKVADFDSNIDGKTTLYAKWAFTATAELEELLGRENKVLNPGTDAKGYIYTENSFAKFDAERDAVAKQINKDYGTLLNPSGDVWTPSSADSLKDLSDEDAAAYLKDLKAAADNLKLTAEAEGAYTDVNLLTPHAQEILNLTADGVIKGYADGTFRGMNNIQRQDFAAYLYRLAGEPEFDEAKATKTFSDVNASTPFHKEILWAASNGIINGFPDGTFGVGRQIVRQDAVAMLYRLAGSPTVSVNDAVSFTDVDETNPHYEAIVWAATNGVTRGFSDGTFGGMKNIVRQDAAAFLQRTQSKVADYLK